MPCYIYSHCFGQQKLTSIWLNLTENLPSFAHFMTCCLRLRERLTLATPLGNKCADPDSWCE